MTTKAACPLCASEAFTIKYPGKQFASGLDLLRCQNCGMSFLSPEEANRTEENKYWDGSKQKYIYSREKIEVNILRDFYAKMGLLDRLLKRQGNILDVGCGSGDFLYVAKNCGWQAYGLDISREAAQIVQEKYGIKVFVGKPEEYKANGVKLDCITMWDVIEHLKDPLMSLTALGASLGQGGVIVLRTPNENALSRRLVRLGARLGIPAFLKYVYYTPHYCYFTKKTLAEALRQAGFEVIKVRKENTDLDFARNKIDAHYQSKEKSWIVRFLPVMNFAASILGMQNKLVVVARKV